jgi:hypothetical protein
MDIVPSVRISSAKHLGILAFGWFVLAVYAFPGLMTMDSVDQLEQARAGVLTDAHPAAMSALWGLIDAVIPGPFGMLVLQSVTFLAGLYLVLRRALSPMAAAIAAASLLVFPPVFTPMAVVWKDSLMAGLLLLGTAGLLSENRRARIAGLTALAGATAARYNAPAATLPLVVILFTWTTHAWWKRYGLALAAWLTLTATALGIGGLLADRKMYIWHSSLALMDIAGTISHVDGTIPDDKLGAILRDTGCVVHGDYQRHIRNAYQPRDFVHLIVAPKGLWNMPIWGTTPAPQLQRDAIARAWWETITTWPGAYLASRAATMKHVLALGEPTDSTVMIHKLQLVERMHALGLEVKGNGVQRKMQRALSALATRLPVLFTPWIYLLLAALLLVLVCVRDRQRDVLAILLSGLGMEASLFVLAASPDYRYSHWLVVCTCLAAVMLAARRFVLHRRPGG